MTASCHPTEPIMVASYAAMFVGGLGMSVGHCLSMCGPLHMGFSSKHSRGTPDLTLFNLGRIVSYMLIGLFFGSLGSLAGWTAHGPLVQGLFATMVGSLILITVLGMKRIRLFLSHPTWGAPIFKNVVQHGQSLPHSGQSLALGFANGFLPCGAVATFALAAAGTSHPITGMLFMGVFGVGTTPALFGVGLAGQRFDPRRFQWIQRVSYIALFLIGAQLLLRGLSSFGWIGHYSVGPFVFW
ncbi:MAG: sulfite exporter TauE/SafE family protein [Candidatus Eisenbacteria bacterium]|uniref:Sulfite exporter TauE/SafE family protein n=1 Tax=Eiseniibacteriota bacterium TaxID=2212470 RepID=A0A7Y2ECJ6_UNCEI|nr:sulfite exporter TauE/SafE family protein [Candidatus Eisenbacteria bacterium]